MLIHAFTRDDGSFEHITLERAPHDAELGDALTLSSDGEPVGPPFDPSIVARVLLRYGKPLADGIALDGPSIALGEGAALVHLRHRARYDVEPRDFLVLQKPGQDPVAELAVTVTGALLHLINPTGRERAR